jgi:hypothetical protein
MDFMIQHDGRDLGPYSESEVRSRLVSGAIALADLGRPTEASEWRPLSSFEQFATSYRQGPPPLPDERLRLPVKQSRPAMDTGAVGAYTRATLQTDERILRKTTIHWMVLMRPALGSLFSLIVIVPIAMIASWKGHYWAWALLVIPAAILLSAILAVKTSELVITDRRVLIKVGFIQRQTFEMFISKIESVAVVQGMIGRMLDYGTVEIRGTGGSFESFATITAPLQFRDAIQLVQSDSERR